MLIQHLLRRTLVRFTFIEPSPVLTVGKFTSSQAIHLYRKFKADQVFTGTGILSGDHVLITTNNGTIVDIVNSDNAGDNIEVFKGLLSPGFINAHCHLELSHLKNKIAAGTGLVDFVQTVMTTRGATAEEKSEAMQAAEEEMYNSGIVAVGDICNTIDSIAVKQQSKISWHNFVEVTGFVDAGADKRLSDALITYDNFKNAGFDRTTLAPHAPYSVSETLFKKLNEHTANGLTSIHNQETIDENELYQSKSGGFLQLYKNFGIDISGFEPSGLPSLQSWLPYFNQHQSIILVHNTFTSQADINFSKAYNSSKYPDAQLHFCLCANANDFIEQTVPPIDLLHQNNCNISIGTDSYASNWQLNILEEIKTILNNAADISLNDALQWATINGAKALRMQDTLGSFEKGKMPGIVLIDHLDGKMLTEESKGTRIF